MKTVFQSNNEGKKKLDVTNLSERRMINDNLGKMSVRELRRTRVGRPRRGRRNNLLKPSINHDELLKELLFLRSRLRPDMFSHVLQISELIASGTEK